MKPFLFLMFCCFSSLVFSKEPISIIPQLSSKYSDQEPKVNLGRELYYENKISRDQTFSCETCHLLDDGGDDNVPASLGARFSKRNSPTLFNSSLNPTQFWDGRVDDLHQQINKLGGKLFDFEEGAVRLNQIQGYVSQFNTVYGEKATAENIKDAIVFFEETLITPDSDFDRFLNGESNAISENAKSGYELFKKFGCSSCHQGKNVGGNLFQKFGVMKDASLRDVVDEDLGRFNITRNEWDKRKFRVPSLRMASLTAPYFHDGSVDTLNEAIKTMSQLQIDRKITPSQINDIAEFIKSLAGKNKEMSLAEKYRKK